MLIINVYCKVVGIIPGRIGWRVSWSWPISCWRISRVQWKLVISKIKIFQISASWIIIESLWKDPIRRILRDMIAAIRILWCFKLYRLDLAENFFVIFGRINIVTLTIMTVACFCTFPWLIITTYTDGWSVVARGNHCSFDAVSRWIPIEEIRFLRSGIFGGVIVGFRSFISCIIDRRSSQASTT